MKLLRKYSMHKFIIFKIYYSTMSEYDDTPSYYNSKEMFEKYLSTTSYYKNLQSATCSFAKTINPDKVLDLGCGTGATTRALSNSIENCKIKAVDMRSDVIEIAEGDTETDDIVYIEDEMHNYVQNTSYKPDLITMVYSFHHLPDPHQNKIDFLKSCYDNFNDVTICISETFLPENNDPISIDELEKLRQVRAIEGYSSTFWNNLDTGTQEGVERAEEIAQFCKKHELEAWENAINRDGEYLIQESWLTEVAEETGFDIIFSKPVNSLGEKVICLKN